MGDLYALGAQIIVNARQEGRLWLFEPKGAPVLFVQKAPIGNRCVKLGDPEKPKGEWNTLDLICFNGDSIHVVNGVVVMRLHGAQRLDGLVGGVRRGDSEAAAAMRVGRRGRSRGSACKAALAVARGGAVRCSSGRSACSLWVTRSLGSCEGGRGRQCSPACHLVRGRSSSPAFLHRASHRFPREHCRRCCCGTV